MVKYWELFTKGQKWKGISPLSLAFSNLLEIPFNVTRTEKKIPLIIKEEIKLSLFADACEAENPNESID